jgi:adenine deaminase
VRKAIRLGLPPISALQIATINPARHYRLQNLGAIAPRFWADFIVFDDWKKFSVRQVYKKGVLVAEDGRFLGRTPAKTGSPRGTMNLRYQPGDFSVKAVGGKKIKVIEIVPQQIVTKTAIVTPKVEDGEIVADMARDILKLVVVERHRATGNVGVGFVRGFKLKRGALGSTVAHDAHNVVVAGTNDADMLCAIQQLERMQGGQVAVANGKIKAELPLPIAGLVSDRPLKEVMKRIDDLNAAARSLGCDLEAPFMTLSFLSLSPIPSLKLTDQGLIDAVKMQRTELWVPA